jgi:hypothetical protein
MGREDETFARDRMAEIGRNIAARASLDARLRQDTFLRQKGLLPKLPTPPLIRPSEDQPREYQRDTPERVYKDGWGSPRSEQKINGMYFDADEGPYPAYHVNGHSVPKEDYESYKQMADSRPRTPGDEKLAPSPLWRDIYQDIKAKKGPK